MKILFASSEAVPFAKTGGLADVATGLTRALAAAGHDVTLMLPYYPRLLPADATERFAVQPTEQTVTVEFPKANVDGQILSARFPDSSLTIRLVDQRAYFDRDTLYTQDGEDYKDNCERFSFFSRAVLQYAASLSDPPEVIHCNDWQTALIPALLSTRRSEFPSLRTTGGLLTIHNLAFQGQFWHWDVPLTGMDWKHFNWEQMEHYGNLNLLKTGIVFSDQINTVSPTYAREIQTAEYGFGLETLLAGCSDKLSGVLNGIDPGDWNPATDEHLPAKYSLENLAGKADCKRALQQELKLKTEPDVPLIGMISRMTDQKGFDLIEEGARQILRQKLQLAFLGTGHKRFEELVAGLIEDHPGQVGGHVGFDESLAHRIEAGADAFLMPSRFEPCGLNQMYSLTYGTPPIVHSVGGLADSVVDATEGTLADGTGNGFVFSQYDTTHLLDAIKRCVSLYGQPEKWQQLVRNGMSGDWSWNRSASDYIGLYERAVACANR